jgi:single stranded DNA-binding protein
MTTNYPFRNEVRITGYVGKAPLLRNTAKGVAATSLRVATEESFVVDGKKQSKTEWHTAVFYGALAQRVAAVDVGNLITIEGRIGKRTFKPTDGSKEREVTEIVAARFDILLTAEKADVPADTGSDDTGGEHHQDADGSDDIPY